MELGELPTADEALEGSRRLQKASGLQQEVHRPAHTTMASLVPFLLAKGPASQLAFPTPGCCLEPPLSSRSVSQIRVAGCAGCGQGLGTEAPPEAASGPS